MHKNDIINESSATVVQYKQVDVFTSIPFKGNPVGVIFNADHLTTLEMQQIANWTNLSETTFVLQPTNPKAAYRVRIFTPRSELPFAGHPTIGTAYALLKSGFIKPGENGVFFQECELGLVELKIEEIEARQCISFSLPEPRIMPLSEHESNELETILKTTFTPKCIPCLIDVGPRWIVVQLKNADAVLNTKPDLAMMEKYNKESKTTGVVIFGEYEQGASADIEVRTFAPAAGIPEDPVCGSGNASVAAFIKHYNKQKADPNNLGVEYWASQGIVVGRCGRVRVSSLDSLIWVGGAAVICIDGQLHLR